MTLRRLAPLAAAIAVLSPLLRAPTSDTYPLSTYPMFASDRGAVHMLPTAVEIDEDGAVRRLSPEVIAGTTEPVLAAVTVSRSIRDGTADQLCAEVAARLGPDRVVEVRTETADVVAMIARDAGPVSVEEHARCGHD